MKFKKGQKVKVISDEIESMIGKICEIKHVDSDGNIPVYTPDKSNWFFFNESDLEPVPEEKTWDTLQVNDVLIDDRGDEKTVVGVCGRVIFYSRYYDKDATSYFKTKETLIKDGWKIKQDTPTEEVVEMTVAEISKALGKTVKVVK